LSHAGEQWLGVVPRAIKRAVSAWQHEHRDVPAHRGATSAAKERGNQAATGPSRSSTQDHTISEQFGLPGSEGRAHSLVTAFVA
jgi:hypothetical protein